MIRTLIRANHRGSHPIFSDSAKSEGCLALQTSWQHVEITRVGSLVPRASGRCPWPRLEPLAVFTGDGAIGVDDDPASLDFRVRWSRHAAVIGDCLRWSGFPLRRSLSHLMTGSRSPFLPGFLRFKAGAFFAFFRTALGTRQFRPVWDFRRLSRTGAFWRRNFIGIPRIEGLFLWSWFSWGPYENQVYFIGAPYENVIFYKAILYGDFISILLKFYKDFFLHKGILTLFF